MEGIVLLLAIVVGIMVFDALALRFGVDSTNGSSDPSSPAGGIEA